MVEQMITSNKLSPVVVMPKGKRNNLQLALKGGSIIIVVGLIAGLVFWQNHKSKVMTTNNGSDKQFVENKLNNALKTQNNAEIISESSQLIAGSKSGAYTISNSNLALYYLYRGSSLTNLNQYSQAISSYQEVEKLDSGDLQAALEGEVIAGYRSGERQQLIPLLQKLVQISSATHTDQMNVTSVQYQDMIYEIQNNQPVDL